MRSEFNYLFSLFLFLSRALSIRMGRPFFSHVWHVGRTCAKTNATASPLKYASERANRRRIDWCDTEHSTIRWEWITGSEFSASQFLSSRTNMLNLVLGQLYRRLLNMYINVHAWAAGHECDEIIIDIKWNLFDGRLNVISICLFLFTKKSTCDFSITFTWKN